MDFLHTLFSFVIAIFILVTIHELGHFLTARKLGVKCLRFSIGFGRPLFTKKIGETEFVVAVVPLGGYVKMLDEREAPVEAKEIGRAFNRQSLSVRSAIVVAGPLANVVLAVLAYWLMLIVGVTGPLPIITKTEPGSIAAGAGLAGGMQILKVDGVSVETWDGVFRKSMNDVLENDKVEIEAWFLKRIRYHTVHTDNKTEDRKSC
jgi:regulator of sigma E protease